MSPITDIQRLKEIRQKNGEKFRIAALPRIDPETGKDNPFVMVDQNDRDIQFLLTQISELTDEVTHLEELLEDEESFDDDEGTSEEPTS